MEAVLHHFKANRRRRLGHIHRPLGRRLGLVFAPHRKQNHDRQNYDGRQDTSETQVKLFANVHTLIFLGRRKDRKSSYCCDPGSKRNSTIPVVSSAAASYRHFRTASSAAVARIGCPPTSFVFLTVPPLSTGIWTLTIPVMLIRRASSGYTGATLFFSLRARSASCPQARGAFTAAHPRMSNRPTADQRVRARKN